MAKLTIVPPADPPQPDPDEMKIVSPEHYSLTDAMNEAGIALKMAHNAGDAKGMAVAIRLRAELYGMVGAATRQPPDSGAAASAAKISDDPVESSRDYQRLMGA
jgi:hypothetical protein